jgi:fumarate reductase flavoprotein subunit
MKQLTSDVIVVAAGASGLAAAVAAAELGNKVISFEKGATTGGTGNMGMGPLAVESRLQRLKQIELTREDAFKIFMDYTHWRVDARLVKTYIDKSASTIDWLEKLGVEFTEPAAYFPGANFTWHLVKPPTGRPGPQSSATLMKILTDNAKDLGVQFYLQTPVTKILKENGKVVGVEAKSASGEEYVAKAKAVIIGTGGFGDSPELIKKYSGYEWGKDFFSMRVPGLVGDGIRMAWEAGAGDTEIGMEIIYGMPMIMDIDLTNLFRQPNLMVNLLGERFMNEEIMGNTTFTGNAIARQKNHCAFIIFDEAIKQYYEANGVDLTSLVHPVDKLTDINKKLKNMFDQNYEYAFVADSIDELASKTGINAANLKATIEEYNKCCETGRDYVMNKKPRYLRPIKQPKFYAGKYYPGAYGSLGGIKINYKCEVLTKDFETIPGLYACGTDACTIYGDSYVFVLPGNTMGFALNTGRIAAENAVKYALGK